MLYASYAVLNFQYISGKGAISMNAQDEQLAVYCNLCHIAICDMYRITI